MRITSIVAGMTNGMNDLAKSELATLAVHSFKRGERSISPCILYVMPFGFFSNLISDKELAELNLLWSGTKEDRRKTD